MITFFFFFFVVVACVFFPFREQSSKRQKNVKHYMQNGTVLEYEYEYDLSLVFRYDSTQSGIIIQQQF